MDTSEDATPSVAIDHSAKMINDDLDKAMAELPDPTLTTTQGPAEAKAPAKNVRFEGLDEIPKQGKKNARFGKNPDGTPAKKADKKEVERKSEWGRWLHDFKVSHPDMHALEATIEARKTYIPKSGKQKSFERIFTEVWKTKNPRWATFTKEQRHAAIRADFIKSIPAGSVCVCGGNKLSQ